MIRCIAIDDEPLALKQIAGFIRKTPFLELVGECENAFQAIKIIKNNEVDLLFLDINLPNLNGIDFAKSIENPPNIIFVTAYSEYAVEGFRMNAIDYLLKPISYSDFLKSANKARNCIENTHFQQPNEVTGMEYLFVKSEHKIVRISLADILYIEGMREYARIHLVNSKPLMPLISMHALERQLPLDKFMRVHRSYIINLNKIITFEHSTIILENSVHIPLSEQYKKLFQGYINSNSTS